MPGGIPHPNRVAIPNPKIYQVKEALEKSGYNEERARTLAQKSDGNLNALLRCLQHLSIMPEWTQRTDASDLAIAELLGGWSEGSDADRAVAEKLSGKAYGEWIGKIRDIALRPGTPLIQRDGSWKVIARYEGWYGLGPRLFDEHLARLKEAAVSVLSERDPKFELPSENRYAALVYGKVRSYSQLLRNGLAESLALLSSHPQALTSCSSCRAETIAILAVRELLEEADWLRWAGLNDVLPLLAEAAPGEFLDLVESALRSDTSPLTLARYPAALSVSTLHASSSRRDKGQLNETVRGVFGSGHLGGGRAAWGLVTLGICIPIQPMTPAWARSETAQRQAATRSVGRGSWVGVTGVGLDPIMTPRQHRLDAPKDPRGASATGPGCRGWSWNSQIRGGCIGLMNCPERECVGVVLMSVGSLARSFAAGPRHNSGSDPRG